MIYVPDLSYNCYIVYDKDTIRAYKNQPRLIGSNDYVDYYVNSHYLSSEGTENLLTLPTCMNSSSLTNEVYYRNDFTSIVLMFVLLAFICFYCPTKLILMLFKKRGNV